MTSPKPRKAAASKRVAGNSRLDGGTKPPSMSKAEMAAAQIVGDVDRPMPGSSLVMHRFRSGELAGQPWISADGVPVDEVNSNRGMREIALQITNWTNDQRATSLGRGRGASIFDRDAYLPPENIFAQMHMARKAVDNDDIVGGTVDATEALAFQTTRFESSSYEDADVFNQWAAMVNLDNFIRVSWQELTTHGQYIVASWWGFKTFKIRGNLPPKVTVDPLTNEVTPEIDQDTGLVVKGQKRRRTFDRLYCPLSLTHLDSTKVIPLGSLMFGQERLVWTATKEEMQAWTSLQDEEPESPDLIMQRLFVGKYNPNDSEKAMLVELGVNTENLLELNPAYVWRHTLTRPHYKAWARVPMKRVFRWLDAKQQLMAADRVSLIGNANYILLVKKGEKDAPATQPELDALNENFAYVARLPVIIGDHTLSVEIITPKMDMTLKQERYAVVDTHIRDALLQTFTTHSSGSREGASGAEITVHSIAASLRNRRHGIKRDLESHIVEAVVNHPLNAEQSFDGEPNVAFSPRTISLGADQFTLQTLVAAKASGDVSRQTYLEEALDLDEEVEARRREFEQQHYDPIFKTATPFNGNDDPQNGDPTKDPTKPGGGPGNSGGGALPPGAGGGGRPPAKPKATPASPTAPKPARAPRGKNR